jgi:Leucine-rich repeat (LRR) protein
MKKRFVAFVLALAGLTANVSIFAESIPIDEAHFPDPVFRNYILNTMEYHKSDGRWDLVGADGKLSDYERKRVVTILLNTGCQSVEGIRYFAKSETGTWGLKIKVYSNDLTTLDLSGMDVTEVEAVGKQLESLNLSGCAKLKSVECQESQLTSLNLSGCVKLESVDCRENKLTSLNVSGCTELTTLTCQRNQLTNLNVRGCTALTTLHCSENQLTSLYTGDSMLLRDLDCSSNQIDALNVTTPRLEVLRCNDNPLLSALFLPDMDSNLSYKPSIYCYKTQIHTLDLRDNEYKHIDCSYSPVNGIEWSQAGNGAVHSFDCSYTDIIEEFILNIPNPEKTTTLRCEDCNLTTLDVSRFTNLELLSCKYNDLTTLNVSHNPALKTISIHGNLLFAIDVTGTVCHTLCVPVQYIEGQATKIDGKTYVRLNNEVNCDSISDMTVWRQTMTTINNPTMLGEYLLVDEGGASDVSKVRYKYHAGNGAWMWVEITTGDFGIGINEYNFPDQKFRNYLLDQSYGADALLTQEEIDGITELYVSEKNIASLEGIQYLRNLVYLDVSKNNLTDAGLSEVVLDLSNLREIQFYNNEGVTWFDASQFPHLETLYGNSCGLTSIDVRGCTELQRLFCDDNHLTNLNVSENPKLRELQCQDNQLTQIYGLGSLTNLRNFDCSNNQFTTLDVSMFPMLADLRCGGNSLTTLDLTHNENLRYLYVEKNQLTALDLTHNQLLKSLCIYGNQLKNDAMRAIAQALPPLATTCNVRAYYQGLATEGNEMSPATVSALRAKGWNPQYTTTGNSWQDYAGGTVAYKLWLRGTQVTSDSAGDLTAIAGVSGAGSFDEQTNTLTLNGATITSNAIVDAIGLKSQIDGLTINLIGTNTINVIGNEAILLSKKTTITGSGRLTAKSNICSIRLNGDTLFVTGGAILNAQNTGTEGYGIFGLSTEDYVPRVGQVTTYHASLTLEGSNTKVLANGPTASVANLHALVRPEDTTIEVTDNSGTRPRLVDGYFFNHNVCTRSGSTYTIATSQVTISCPRDGIAINAANFPNEIVRNYLHGSSIDKDGDWWLTNDELEDISDLSLNNQGVTDLTGITHLFALERVYVNGNALETADFTGLTGLQNIDIMENQLTAEGITNMISSLPEGDGSTNTILIFHVGSNNEGNVTPDIQHITAAYQKGWKLMYQAGDGTFHQFEAGIEINTTNFPDDNFRSFVAENYDPDGDGFLLYTEAQDKTQMNLHQRDIEDLTGIEYFTGLEWLDCSYNRLTQLRLTKNTNLKTLLCNNNLLTDLRTSNCYQLRFLACYNNRLNETAMKMMVSNLPDRSEETEPGMIYVISKASSEGNTISMERVKYLKEGKNWTCYYTIDYTDWFEFEEFVVGDVNNDGSVTIADVTALVNIILGKSETPASGVADVNNDGSVTIADVTALVNIILGKD